MSAQILNETSCSFADAARVIPGQNGKPICFSTLWRWALKGIRTDDGRLVRLEALRLGGKWITSKEAIVRFCERITPDLSADTNYTRQTPTARTRANEKAKRELEKAGI